jgi:hypothetical protein
MRRPVDLCADHFQNLALVLSVEAEKRFSHQSPLGQSMPNSRVASQASQELAEHVVAFNDGFVQFFGGHVELKAPARDIGTFGGSMSLVQSGKVLGKVAFFAVI